MDLLLIYPRLSKQESYQEIKVSDKIKGTLPPLGITTLAAYLIENKFNVGIIDPLVEGMSTNNLLNYIEEKKPSIIGFSVLTPTFEKAKDIAREIKKKYPDKIMIIGGHHITIFPKESVTENLFDIFVYGEGEITSLELMNFLKTNNYDKHKIFSETDHLKRINGLIFKENTEIITTSPRELIPDLDMLPFPARHLLKMEEYIPLPIEYKRLPAINMMVSRGCPFNCTYCSTHGTFGYKLRFRSPEKVIKEIKHIIEKYGAKQISFWDDVLTVNKKWIHQLCDLIIQEKLDIIWNCYAHANTVDDYTLKKMKQAGCFCIWYGIEAGDDFLLKMINKGTTLESIKKAVKLTHDNDIEVRGLFMIGLPGETPELAQKTINFAKELNVDYAQFSITTPHVGTKLYDDAHLYGTLKKDFSRYTQHEAVFVPFGYKNKEEVEEMCRKAYRDFYHRPSYLLKQVLKIRTIDDIKRYYNAFKIAKNI
ncbi:radical SAM protein [Candidatus Woesearchaeota archaeon]|nr:radical SAM protein [Candidatus Woesearchaeota archaeon]